MSKRTFYIKIYIYIYLYEYEYYKYDTYNIRLYAYARDSTLYSTLKLSSFPPLVFSLLSLGISYACVLFFDKTNVTALLRF